MTMDDRKQSYCGGDPCCSEKSIYQDPGALRLIETPAGPTVVVSTKLMLRDLAGRWAARWSMGRSSYRVSPGLYAVGSPNESAPVLVTANYKMSFDSLRSCLKGISAWILVLDTRGINVWCAAGKGTFGTDELVSRISDTSLKSVVSHRKVILPQLGAPGVSAHEVRARSDFQVIYGPIEAEDLPAFLSSGNRATPEMRRKRFPMSERVALIPVELAGWAKYLLILMAAVLLLSGLSRDGYSMQRSLSLGPWNAGLLLLTYLATHTLVPALLPWIPGRAFSVKGLWPGLILAVVLGFLTWDSPGVLSNRTSIAGWILLIPAVTSFLAMNFTGSTTYTSLSGALYEMRRAMPFQVAAFLTGSGLWLWGRFL